MNQFLILPQIKLKQSLLSFLFFVSFLNCRKFRRTMELPQILGKLDLWPLHVKLLRIYSFGIELLYLLDGEGNKVVMFLIGMHRFFSSPSPFTGSGILMQASNSLISQAAYNFTISRVCLHKMLGAAFLFTLFDQHQARQEIIPECRVAFRKIVSTRGWVVIYPILNPTATQER